jgi:hypothetical protein
MVSRLEKIDTLIADEIANAMLLGEPPLPSSR